LLRRTDVFRTNQLRGAWTAAIASLLHRKPLLVRTGYIWSQFEKTGKTSKIGRLRSRFVFALERFAIRRASLVITASEADRESIIGSHGIPEGKVEVIPNPIDTELFSPAAEGHVQPGLVTFVGRLEPQKGVDLLIEAVHQLPGAKLRVVGDGSLRTTLENMATAQGVEFTGTVPNEQLPSLLSETAVFVLPSHFEGTPKALLEAMACGAAVVATRVPGSNGIVEHGKTGLVAEPNAEALAAAIGSILANHELRDRLGAAARRHVEERHSMLAAAERESELIRSVFTGNHARSEALSDHPQITESSKPEDAFTRENQGTNTAA
jgi:glycosyltransferase involved in cell wall biosynthesis